MNNLPVIINVSNQFGRVISKTPEVDKILEESLSYFDKDSFFSPLYQDGKWDGFRRFYSTKTGKFRTGVLKRVITTLREQGYEIELRDGRIFQQWSPVIPKLLKNDSGYTQRDYQQGAVDAILNEKRGVVRFPPRGGKTIVAIEAIKKIGWCPTCYICYRTDTFYQVHEKFTKAFNFEIGLIGDGKFELRDINVAMIHTLQAGLENNEQIKKLIHESKVVFIDEVHHVTSTKLYKKVLTSLKNALIVVGLSATPKDDKGEFLFIESLVGPVICSTSFGELVKEGFLAEPVVYIYNVQKYEGDSNVFDEVYREYIVRNQLRNWLIRRVTLGLVKANKCVAILVKLVEHGKLLSEMIEGSLFFYGKDPTSFRKEVLKGIQDGNIPVVITTLFEEAIDLPRLDAVIIAAGGESSVATIQRLRSLTAFGGKEKGIVIDFMDNAPHLRKHSKHRFNIYKKEGFNCVWRGFRSSK